MAKETAPKSKRKKRSVVTVQGPTFRARMRDLLASPRFGWGVVTIALFTLLAGAIVVWAWEQPLVSVGRVMDRTRTARVDFQVLDEAATNDARELARQQTSRVFTIDPAVIEQIRNSLDNLPTTLAALDSVEDLADEIRRPFELNAEEFAAVKAATGDADWGQKVARLAEVLRTRPMLTSADWQVAVQQGSDANIELRRGDGPVLVSRSRVINIDDDAEQLRESASVLARQAGFTGALERVAAARLVSERRPTYRYEPGETTAAQNERADAVEPIYQNNPAGTPMFVRGTVLTPAQYDRYRAEQQAFRASAGAWRVWTPRVMLVALVAGVAVAGAAYVAVFCARVRRNPDRMAGLGVLALFGVGVACVSSVLSPGVAGLTVVAPVMFVATILVVAYEQRTALAIGGLTAVVVCIALRQPVGMFALCSLGAGVAAWRLQEIRDRRTLISMAAWSAVLLAAGSVVVGFIDRPVNTLTAGEIGIDALFAASGGLIVGMLTLFVLQIIERAFDITTGMTLIELRDPKQPLLRELQQRAPGTYNHSMNVASISESAADAVGADSLLTYVGALYHDIGKMNKPEYFVENQGGGTNKHEKLSPAMSLLVIVGHVKDGLEMARDHGLPRRLQHFIEAHHGTTLVEYFYERARERAEAEGAEAAAEIEYRYPGPKPQTKEVAILMLADAVESATRSLPEPTPSRIDALVRKLANKRLLDGQFDDCDLTLKEVRRIADSISKSVSAIYHARIAYPGDKSRDEAKAERA